MKIRAPILLLAALLPAMAAAVPPGAAARLRSRGLHSSAPTRITRSGRVVVPVLLDGRGPFRFLVDTGANGSMVAPRLVKRLGLVPGQGVVERVEGVTGTQVLPWVLIRRLQVGRIVKTDVRMPICSSRILTHLDGILGMAGFGPVRIAVDFRSHRVSIGRSGRGALGGFLEIHATRTPGGLLMVPARVGGVSVEAIIDTGSPETLGDTALRNALLARRSLDAAALIYGVTRQVATGARAWAPTLMLGPAAVEHLPIVYADAPIFTDWHLESRPAVLLGMDMLSAVDALVLDYPRARVYILPPPRPISMAEPAPPRPEG